MSDDSSRDMPRRDFLMLTWRTSAALAAASTAFVGLRFLAPRDGDGAFGGVIVAGLLDDFPPGTVTRINEGRFYLVRFDDGGLLALYRRCTHLNCTVLWDETAGRFSCPCHGSEFEMDGDVLNPPAPDPLTRFPITVENGTVSVDTGNPIGRSATHPEDILYSPGEMP
jgi:cytochrome b6-f complex iron-sulfur subunit